jgi:hypothetical protein
MSMMKILMSVMPGKELSLLSEDCAVLPLKMRRMPDLDSELLPRSPPPFFPERQ